mgnify:CR=1 FL=1
MNMIHLIHGNLKILIMNNKIELLEEDIECVHLYLDDKNIPRYLGEDEYSIVGRIQILEKRIVTNMLKKLNK